MNWKKRNWMKRKTNAGEDQHRIYSAGACWSWYEKGKPTLRNNSPLAHQILPLKYWKSRQPRSSSLVSAFFQGWHLHRGLVRFRRQAIQGLIPAVRGGVFGIASRKAYRGARLDGRGWIGGLLDRSTGPLWWYHYCHRHQGLRNVVPYRNLFQRGCLQSIYEI